MRRRELADVDRAGGEGDTLTDTDDGATNEEDGEVASGAEALDECCDDDEDAARAHANAAAEVVGNGTCEEEASYDGSDRVRRVDATYATVRVRVTAFMKRVLYRWHHR